MRRPGRILAALVLALVPLPLASCARSEPPPGTRPDNTPPRTEELRPDYRAEVPGFDGFARVQFDEPLSNPRNLGRDIVGSPAGRYETKPGRRGLEVRPEDGWQDSVVYYIRLPSGVSDLLRNRTTEPVEWLFSTGGAVPDTEVRGRVIDRVTARGESGLRVLFLGADSIPYTVVSDTGGTFRLPGLPPGDYEAVGFQDQNRNFTYDTEFEPGGRAEFTVDDDAASAELRIVMLPADTTPPVLASATAPDSVTLRLEFDDPLDPETELADVTIAVRDTLTGPA
ncbi:MAG: carboxypeptidase-like regulatory domain-containing protein, partial [Gemmatimonadota bacterium]